MLEWVKLYIIILGMLSHQLFKPPILIILLPISNPILPYTSYAQDPTLPFIFQSPSALATQIFKANKHPDQTKAQSR